MYYKSYIYLISLPLLLSLLTILIFSTFVCIYIYFDKKKLDKSNYKNESGNNYFKTKFNTGYYGEYLTFQILEKVKGYSKILTNIYIPREDNTSTEIDVLLIHETGIYVIESKNYSGWIFGSEDDKYWTQTLKNGKKEKFRKCPKVCVNL